MSQHSSLLAVDKNELMKERMRMEKVKKCDKRPNSDVTVPQPSQKKKRKHPGNSADDQDKEKRFKEKDDKRKKKEEDKQRQALLIETRKEKLRLRPDGHPRPNLLTTALGGKKLWLLLMHMFVLPLLLLNQIHSLQVTQTTAATVTEPNKHTVSQTQLLFQACSTTHLITLSAARSQSIQRAGVSSHSNLSPVSSNMCSPQTNVSLQSKRQTPVLTQTPENSFTPSSRSSHNNEPRRGLHFDSARQVAWPRKPVLQGAVA